jgi:hypothetical protein
LRLALPLVLAVLTQAVSADPTQHLRYLRPIELPAHASGPVCAVLDATAFAHAASRSADDLRVYREPSVGKLQPTEVPFTLLESEASPEDAVPATVANLAVHDDTLSFDLLMPQQAYTAVELRLAATNFLAVATVSAVGPNAQPPTQLGTFTLFDLTRERLGRSTELPLQEAHLSRLHIGLRLWNLDGTPIQHPSPAIVQGADVPPSRQAQTLYTTVSPAARFHEHGSEVVATLRIPAHIPVERLRFLPVAGQQGSFARTVTIAAQAKGTAAQEVVEGTISRVDISQPSPAAPAVHYESLTVDATLGANLREPAVISVTVPGPRAPVAAVELQMRQRTFCFQADAGARYTLRYGDAGLGPPVYQEMPDTPTDRLHATAASHTPLAQLGPEQQNPAFVGRVDPFAVGAGHPQMFWVGLLSMVTLSGALAVHRMRPVRGGRSQ